MLCTIHQPQFIPWIGYMNKMAIADVFVFLDDVQYKKNEYQNRNRIRTQQGWVWLTVPVRFKFGDKINETLIADELPWRRKSLATLQGSYAKAPFFKQYFGAFSELIEKPYANLAELNMAVVRWMAVSFDLNTKIEVSSTMDGLPEDPTRRLSTICRKMGADRYLSGKDGPVYMDMPAFSEEGVDVYLQMVHHPVYPQCMVTEEHPFEPYMSAIDLLFNVGGQEGGRIIRECGHAEIYKQELK